MVDIISYIRSLTRSIFPREDIARKRKAPPDYDLLGNSKIRKVDIMPLSSSNQDGSSYGSASILHRSSLRSSNTKSNWSNDKAAVVIDDDNDDRSIAITQPKQLRINLNDTVSKLHPTSTPRLQLNGNDLRKLKISVFDNDQTKKQNVDNLKFSYLNDDNTGRPKLRCSMKSKDFTTPTFNRVCDVRNKLGLDKRPLRSSTLNHSIRLDEKRNYKELLSQTKFDPKLINHFTKYSTLSGRLFEYGINPLSNRTKKIIDLTNGNTKPSMSNFIDLTTTNNQKKKLSTKDTVKSVLDKLKNGSKDSNSNLPTPPDAKPDFQIPSVNTLKILVNGCERTHEEWLDQRIQRHRREVTKHEIVINQKISEGNKLQELNFEIYTQRLGEQLNKYLHIKDAILPVSFKVVEFPTLTEEDDSRINHALSQNKKINPDEILSETFSLQITRRDMSTLAGLNWLNDEVINFYMNLIIERGKLNEWPTAYAMNTFFYQKLITQGPTSLRRWTKRVDLFSYVFVAVPIHLGFIGV